MYELSQQASKYLTLFIFSGLFTLIPWVFNLLYLIWQRMKWRDNRMINHYIRNYAWLFFGLSMLSGGANASINLCSSKLFGVEMFSMKLARHDYIKLSKIPILLVILLENLPQICIQLGFVILTQNSSTIAARNAAIFSLISSSTAVIFALGVLILQGFDPLDDEIFKITVKIDFYERMETAKKYIGMRRKLGKFIEDSIEKEKGYLTVDYTITGKQKIHIYVSVNDPLIIPKHLTDQQINDFKQQRINKILKTFRMAKTNGKMAAVITDVLKLENMCDVKYIQYVKKDELKNIDFTSLSRTSTRDIDFMSSQDGTDNIDTPNTNDTNNIFNQLQTSMNSTNSPNNNTTSNTNNKKKYKDTLDVNDDDSYVESNHEDVMTISSYRASFDDGHIQKYLKEQRNNLDKRIENKRNSNKIKNDNDNPFMNRIEMNRIDSNSPNKPSNIDDNDDDNPFSLNL